MPRNSRYDRAAGFQQAGRRGGGYESESQRYDRQGGYRRPWVGGYQEGYQGGTEGVSLNTTGPYYHGAEDVPLRSGVRGRDEGQRGGRYDREYPRASGPGYRRGEPYDRSYNEPRGQGGWRRLEEWRPKYSPVGGMHPAMGGEYKYGGEQHRGTGYDGWYSQRTRWF